MPKQIVPLHYAPLFEDMHSDTSDELLILCSYVLVIHLSFLLNIHLAVII